MLNSPVNDHEHETILKLIGIRTFALRTTPQLTRITEHIVQRNFRNNGELILADLRIQDRSTTLINSSNDIACVQNQG
jgi:hypothetical protein